MDDQPRIDLDELRTALTGRLESLAEHLLGGRNRSRSRGSQWRWGSQGSLSLETRGRKRGSWHSHEDGDGGGPLDLIRFAKGLSFAEAIEWGAAFTGLGPAAETDNEEQRRRATERAAERERKRLADEAEEAADQQRRIAVARRMWEQARPPAATIAARYLSEARRIPMPDWPEAVRFLPADTVTLREQGPDGSDVSRTLSTAGAIVLAATTPDGAVQAIQRIYLSDGADNLRRSDGGKVKLTLGVPGGAAARLPGRADGPLLIAEGPETGLSVWCATGHETWIALGSMGTVELPPGRQVVVCRDDDRPHSPADKALSRALAKWGKAQLSLVVATPWSTRRGDKSDFNDAIRDGGIGAVRARIQGALYPHGEPPVRITIEEGRGRLRAAVAGFFADTAEWARAQQDAGVPAGPDRDTPPPDDWEWADDDLPPEPPPAVPDGPPVRLVAIDVGAGKSAVARQLAAKTLAAMRAEGNTGTIVMAVPTHQLGAEQQLAFEALPEVKAAGLKCRSWRGRRAEDPDAPGEKMCRNLALVREVQAFRLDVEKRACGICPFKPGCAYLAQRKHRADLWFVAHQMIYEAKPKAMGALAAVIVDENPIAGALEGVEREGGGSQRPLHLPLDVLNRDDPIEGQGGGIATARLMFLRRAALDILRDHADGPIHRVVFDDGLITAANAREARGLEWRTLIDVELTPEMTRDERAVALQAAHRNADVGRRVMFWSALEALLNDGPEASGWAAIGGGLQPDQPTARHIDLKGRREIGKHWRVPTLVLDATAKPDLLRYLWPALTVAADLRIQAPHQHVRQTTDCGFALSRLDVDGAKDDEERRHRQRNLRSLHAIICREARRFAPGRVLVVAQQRIKSALLGLGQIPANAHLEHHNAVRGRDEYRDARALIVVGRTMPPSSIVARMLEALTGAAAPTLAYERAGAVREFADGSMRPCEALRYPDAAGEALRWQACEAEVVQIIGRGRAVNRTAETPLDVLALTDVPLPMPVRPIAAAELAPTPADLMAAAGAVVFGNPGHASEAYPGLWATRNTAKTAFRRGKLGSFPYEESLSYTDLNPTSPWREIEYQRVGQGCSPAVAWFDDSLVSDPEGALAGLIGPLAWCRRDAGGRDRDDEAGLDPGSPQLAGEQLGSVPGLDPATLYPPAPAGAEIPPSDMLVIRLPGGGSLRLGAGRKIGQRDFRGTYARPRHDVRSRPLPPLLLPPLAQSSQPPGARAPPA